MPLEASLTTVNTDSSTEAKPIRLRKALRFMQKLITNQETEPNGNHVF